MPVGAGDGPGRMDDVMARAAKAGAEVLVLDGSMVFGMCHLRSALYHAVRAIQDGSNSSESVLMETLLYASGERQLSAAIKKMSVSERTRELVAARLKGGDFEPGDAWVPVPDSPPPPDKDRLLKFGLTAEEIGTVGPDRVLELVLEKVAAVDILKR